MSGSSDSVGRRTSIRGGACTAEAARSPVPGWPRRARSTLPARPEGPVPVRPRQAFEGPVVWSGIARVGRLSANLQPAPPGDWRPAEDRRTGSRRSCSSRRRTARKELREGRPFACGCEQPAGEHLGANRPVQRRSRLPAHPSPAVRFRGSGGLLRCLVASAAPRSVNRPVLRGWRGIRPPGRGARTLPRSTLAGGSGTGPRGRGLQRCSPAEAGGLLRSHPEGWPDRCREWGEPHPDPEDPGSDSARRKRRGSWRLARRRAGPEGRHALRHVLRSPVGGPPKREPDLRLLPALRLP